MKPDWEDAPEWANWLAMDRDGDWVWHERKPVKEKNYWRPTGRWDWVETVIRKWSETLESRVETTKPAEAGSEGQGA